MQGSAVSDAALDRRRQRRPNLQKESEVPADVRQKLSETVDTLDRLVFDAASTIRDAADKVPDTVSAFNRVTAALRELTATGSTPEQQLQSVSRVTNALQGEPFTCTTKNSASVPNDTIVTAFAQTLLKDFFTPVLLDARLRYLHRAVSTAVRKCYTLSETDLATIRESFLQTLVRVHYQGDKPNLYIANVSTIQSSPEEIRTDRLSIESRTADVVAFINTLDALTGTLMPLVPQLFHSTFPEMLPLLGQALMWSVDNALRWRRRDDKDRDEETVETDSANGTTSAVFGEDIDHIRFAVKVIASYFHRYSDEVRPELCTTSEARLELGGNLCRLVLPCIQMFSSFVFPKDVLNAVGLLFCSLLTVNRTTDYAGLVRQLCCWLCRSPQRGQDESVHRGAPLGSSSSSNASPAALEFQRGVAQQLVRLMMGERTLTDVTGAAASESSDAGAVASPGVVAQSVAQFTPCARFAILKGLLAHFSTPLHGMPTVGTLLEAEASTGHTALFTFIIPFTMEYCAAIEEPETRFMAMQTIDNVVRYVEAVYRFVLAHMEGVTADSPENKKAARKKQTLADVTLHTVPDYCHPTPALMAFLQRATQLVMDMWDDATQQVSGALHDTYGEVLRIHEHLRALAPLLSTTAGVDAQSFTDAVSVEAALRGVLDVRSERRGKYRALQSLLLGMPFGTFLGVLREFYQLPDNTASSHVKALSLFSRSLLAVACNRKVNNAAGEVLCVMVKAMDGPQAQLECFSGDNKSTAALKTQLVEQAVLQPVADAISVPGYIPVPSNIETRAAVSSVAAHFVAPLVGYKRPCLAALLDLLAARYSHTTADRVSQAIVEILSRSRTAGFDAAANYMSPPEEFSLRSLQRKWAAEATEEKRTLAPVVFDVVCQAVHSVNAEMRDAALSLCVLSPKKAELVKLWQCDMVEMYASVNMHPGGDSIARKLLLSTLQRWVTRLATTHEAQAKDAEKTSNRAYTAMVESHAVRLANLFARHLGVGATAGQDLSAERVVTAVNAYTILLDAFLATVNTSHTVSRDFTQSLFVTAAVPALMAELSNGWSHARASAQQLLSRFLTHCPAVETVATLMTRGAAAPSSHSNSSSALVTAREAAHAELVAAHRFRDAEGAVMRYTLLSKALGASSEELLQTVQSELRAVRRVSETLCGANSGAGSATAAVDLLYGNPIHGRLSLCSELLISLLTAGRDSYVHTQLLSLANEGMAVCDAAIQACAGSSGGSDDVDCRGHVFNKDATAQEAAKLRRVVNNTWLGVRVATSVVDRLAVYCDQLECATVRGCCFTLANALLTTKHNGVMRCVRSALKTLMAALVRSHKPDFHQVPSQMLQFLLGPEGVTSQDVGRMLRRSQGLPHALLAVLEAEDPKVPPVLFPRAMRALFAAARLTCGDPANHGASDEVVRSQRSNGINVLKFVFENKLFADNVIAYIEDAFSVATQGFTDGSWSIRNSCLMLFSSVLHRFVGEHPSTGGSGANTSLHDIAIRTPRGLAFAFHSLQSTSAASCTTSSSATSGELALFPVLQMLSMLSPDPPHLLTKVIAVPQTDAESEKTAATGEQDDTGRMIAAVRNQLGSANIMVRSAAAAALPCLVHPDVVPSFFGGFSASADGERFWSPTANGLHGLLLALHEFLVTYHGTMHRPRRRSVSGSSTTHPLPVRMMVLRTVESVLLNHAELMVRGSVAIPTVAATLFTLLGDFCRAKAAVHLYEEAHAGFDLEENVGVRALVGCFACRADGACCLPAPPPAERGTVPKYAAAFLASFFDGVVPSGRQLPNSLMESVGAALRGDVAEGNAHASVVNARPHSLVVWLAHYLERLGTSCVSVTALLRSPPISCDLHDLAQRAVLRAQPPLECNSSGAFVSYMQFLAVVCEKNTSTEAKSGAAPLSQQYSQLVTRFQRELDGMLTGSAAGAQSCLATSAACAAALRLVNAARDSGAVSESWLATALAHFAQPRHPLELRLCVLDILDSPSRVGLTSRQPLALAVVLLLLFDDVYAVRERACLVAAATTNSGAPALDAVSTAAKLTWRLRQARLCAGESFPSKDIVENLLMSAFDDETAGEGASSRNGATSAAPNGTGALDGGRDDEEEGDEDDDGLFKKEGDNMYAEEPVMRSLLAAIFCAEPSRDTDVNASLLSNILASSSD